MRQSHVEKSMKVVGFDFFSDSSWFHGLSESNGRLTETFLKKTGLASMPTEKKMISIHVNTKVSRLCVPLTHEAMWGLGWSLWAGLPWIWCQARWMGVAKWKVMTTWAAAHASQDSYLKSVWESLAQLEQPWTQDALIHSRCLIRKVSVHWHISPAAFLCWEGLSNKCPLTYQTQAQVDLRCERYHGELSPGLGCLTIWRFQKLVVESWK